MSNFNKKRIATLSGLLALSLFTLSALPAAGAPTYTLKVQVVLADRWMFSGAQMYDDPGVFYSPTDSDLGYIQYNCKKNVTLDLLIGANVKVTNESGKIVGLSKITKCSFVQQEAESSYYNFIFYSTIKVTSAKFYNVSIDGIRGPDYSFSELKKKKWSLKLFI